MPAGKNKQLFSRKARVLKNFTVRNVKTIWVQWLKPAIQLLREQRSEGLQFEASPGKRLIHLFINLLSFYSMVDLVLRGAMMKIALALTQKVYTQFLFLLLICCVTLVKTLNSSEPQFPHL
jgi:hypothetical protein